MDLVNKDLPLSFIQHPSTALMSACGFSQCVVNRQALPFKLQSQSLDGLSVDTCMHRTASILLQVQRQVS